MGTPPFNHANGGTGDCVSCHAANAGLNWSSASGHSSTLTNCIGCHGPSNTTTAGLISQSTSYQMDHTYSTILSGSPDCYSCHGQANGFTSWELSDRVLDSTIPPVLAAQQDFHLNIGTPPTSCTTCHSPEVPSGTVPNTVDGFNHLATYGTECASCHTNVPGNVGVSWKAPFFNHLNNSASALGTCSPCHDTNHHNAGQLCTNCHKSVRYRPPPPLRRPVGPAEASATAGEPAS